MSLLDLKTDRYHWETINRLPEPPRNLDHHDLLVDVLREEFEDTHQELRNWRLRPTYIPANTAPPPGPRPADCPLKIRRYILLPSPA